MTLDMLNYYVAWPEIFLLIMTCVVLVVDIYLTDDRRNVTYVLSQLSLLGTLLIIVCNMAETKTIAFNGTYISDAMGDLLKFFVVAIVAVVFVYSRDYLKIEACSKASFICWVCLVCWV